MEIKSFVDQLKADVINLQTKTSSLIDVSSIRIYRNDPNSRVIVIAPTYRWGELSSEGETIQTQAIGVLDDLISRLDLLFEAKPVSVSRRYRDIKKYFNDTIKRESISWSVPASIDDAQICLQNKIEELNYLLDWLQTLGNQETIIVPDTNALIINNRLESYGELLGSVDQWTVIITSTVLRELDELKIKNIGNEFREKVKKTINYLKGLRSQGDARNGINIFNSKVVVKLQAIEPNMNKTLPWLNADNNDDRIIASCFDVQIRNPASSVILMTADINLQTKAQMARLPFIEPDK